MLSSFFTTFNTPLSGSSISVAECTAPLQPVPFNGNRIFLPILLGGDYTVVIVPSPPDVVTLQCPIPGGATFLPSIPGKGDIVALVRRVAMPNTIYAYDPSNMLNGTVISATLTSSLYSVTIQIEASDLSKWIAECTGVAISDLDLMYVPELNSPCHHVEATVNILCDGITDETYIYVAVGNNAFPVLSMTGNATNPLVPGAASPSGALSMPMVLPTVPIFSLWTGAYEYDFISVVYGPRT